LHLASLCQLLWLCSTMRAGPAAGTATATASHCAANPISSILKWGESVSIYKNPTHFHIVIKAFPFRNGLKSCACRRAPKSWLWLAQSTSNALQTGKPARLDISCEYRHEYVFICSVWSAWTHVGCTCTCTRYRAAVWLQQQVSFCGPHILQFKYFFYRLLLQHFSILFHNDLPSSLSFVFPLSYISPPYQFSLVYQICDLCRVILYLIHCLLIYMYIPLTSCDP